MIVEVKKFKMDYIITKSDGSEALYHHGIKGMHWGVRRYRNSDGTLTEAGKRRYNSSDANKKRNRKIAIAAGATVGAALAGYGVYKLSKTPYLKKAIKTGRQITKETMKQLVNKSPNTISDTILSVGKTSTTVLLTGAMIYGGEKMIAQQIGKDNASKIVQYGRQPKKKGGQ